MGQDGGSEPALHYLQLNPQGGWWGITEVGCAYCDGRENRVRDRWSMPDGPIRNGESVGILVNRDEKSMRVFRGGQPFIQIDDLPEGNLWPVVSPYAFGLEVTISFPEFIANRRPLALWAASTP